MDSRPAKNFFRVLAATILCLVLSSCSIPVNRPFADRPFVVGITTTKIDAQEKQIEYCGNGFVLNKEQKLIVTAKHVIYPDLGSGHSLTKVIINRKSYPAYCIWSHPTSDIGILKIVTPETIELLQLNVASVDPPPNTPALLVGFESGNTYFGQSRILVKIVDDHTMDKELNSYIAADVPKEYRLKDYRGLSGSVLLNNKNDAVAIMTGTIEICFIPLHRIFFVPLKEVPKNYLPTIN